MAVKKVSKKPVKKVAKKAVVKKAAVVKVSKTVKKLVSSNKKQVAENKKLVSANKKMAQKAVKQNISQDKEIAKLKEDLAKLKATNKDKKNTKRVSEYNLFIRKQILSGLTFERAVKEWNKYKALESKNTRRPSAYNQFIGSQMRLGKTFLQAVALWKLAKAGKLGKKGTTKTVTKVKYKTRTIKSKPQIITRTRTIKSKPQIITKIRRVKSKPEVITKIKRIASKPKVITKIQYRTKEVPVEKTKVVQKDVDYDRIRAMLTTAINTSTVNKSESSSKTVSVSDIKTAVSADDDEIAFKLVQTYFKEIARFGLKKQLTLDEIIDSYIYSLARVKRYESRHLEESVRRAGLKK